MTRHKDAEGPSAETLPIGGGIEAWIRASLDDVREQAPSPAELALVEILAEQIASQARQGAVACAPVAACSPGGDDGSSDG